MHWRRSFETGLADIDSQHRYFYGLIQRVYELRDAHSSSSLRVVAEEVLRYGTCHFQCEDALMVAYEYPDRAFHESEHTRLIAAAQHHCLRHHIDGLALSEFLETWFVHHTQGDDKRLAAHILERRRQTFGPTCRTVLGFITPTGGFI